MKHLSSILVILCLLATNLIGQISAYEQLVAVNTQWENHKTESPETTIPFDNDEDRIAYHLQLVVESLRQTTQENVSKKALRKRTHLLEQLAVYASSKRFPTNSFHPTRQPCFIDKQGTHCAVGYLMSVSGHEALAQHISQQYNYSYIHDMPVEEISPWAKEYGFSIDELAWIQPGYSPQETYSAFPNGPNGTIDHMVLDSGNNRLILAGAFSEIGGTPCNRIASFSAGSFSCIDFIVNGQINGVLSKNNVIYVVGAILLNNGVTVPMASFENGIWTYYNPPGQSTAEGTLIFSIQQPNHIGVGLRYASKPTEESVWYVSSNNSWNKKFTVNGSINAHTSTGSDLFFGGSFDTATVKLLPGPFDSTIVCHNLISKEAAIDNYETFGNLVSDTISALEVVGNDIYIGGFCNSGQQDICLSSLSNGALQPLLFKNDFQLDEPTEIRDMAQYQGNLILGGNFHTSHFIVGNFGNHLVEFDLVSNYIDAIAQFDLPVNKVAQFNNSLYIGGAFTQDVVAGMALPYFAVQDALSPNEEPHPHAAVTIYPNPVSNFAWIDQLESSYSYSVFDVTGVELQRGEQQPHTPINFSHLPTGVFLMTIRTEAGSFTRKLIKG